MELIAEPATIGVHGLVECMPVGRRGCKGRGVVWELTFAFTGLAADVALGGHYLSHPASLGVVQNGLESDEKSFLIDKVSLFNFSSTNLFPASSSAFSSFFAQA